MIIVSYSLNPTLLNLVGPTIDVLLDGRPFKALIDTGADRSSVDMTNAAKFGWPSNGVYEAIGVTSKDQYPLYEVKMTIPTLNNVEVQSPVPGLPLKRQGMVWDAIVGRDILSQFELRINGTTGLVTFLQ